LVLVEPAGVQAVIYEVLREVQANVRLFLCGLRMMVDTGVPLEYCGELLIRYFQKLDATRPFGRRAPHATCK
jgi:hypothetical protein